MYIGFWGAAPRPKFTKMGEDMLHTSSLLTTANFIAAGQTVYDKSITKNFQMKSKLYIPTILPFGGIKIYFDYFLQGVYFLVLTSSHLISY